MAPSTPPPQQHHKQPHDDLPPSVRRRRRTSLYRHSSKSMMFDKVIIGFAVLVAFIMISTRGCNRGLKGLTTLLTGKQASHSSPDKMELQEHEQTPHTKP